TAPSESLIARLQALGPRVTHAFGMTETTQALSVSIPDPGADPAERHLQQLSQGQPIFLSDVRVVDESGVTLAEDGASVGHLQVRGPAVASAYFGQSKAYDSTPGQSESGPFTSDGWLDTGDIGTLDPAAWIRITDRAKDAIKSGGEWISSVTLENIAAGCPGVAEATCIGVAHPRWQERPVLLLVPEAGASPRESQVRDYLRERIARWWMPDAILFVPTLPRNAVGKVQKSELRDRYRNLLGERPPEPRGPSADAPD
ncbi:MAG: AMP-binding protein, partial [Gammaproteobacteria bacterium]|nr:AMP-binding protein [Gammaproteobacteria bacterium]